MMSANPLKFVELGEPEQPTIILLHGVGLGHRMWQPQLSLLSERYHMLVPDLPGFGDSLASGPFTMKGAALAVADLLRLKSKKPAHICGLSLGAMVALQIYLEAPDLVNTLLLSGAQVHPNPLLMLIQRVIVSFVSEEKLRAGIVEIIPAEYPEVITEVQNDVQRVGKSGLLDGMREVGNVNFRKYLADIKVPTLVMCGSKDAWNLKAAQELAIRIPNAKLQIIPGAGHVWNLEMPDVFNEMVLSFVESVASSQMSQQK